MPASFKLFMGNVFSFVLDCQFAFCSFFLFSFGGLFQCFYALFHYTFIYAFQLNLWTLEPNIVIDNWIKNCWNLLIIMGSWTREVIAELFCFSFGAEDWQHDNRFHFYPQWRKTIKKWFQKIPCIQNNFQKPILGTNDNQMCFYVFLSPK